jgi:hypothetical protein
VLFARFSEFSPSSTSFALIAEPTEVYSFLLNGTGVEGACGAHSVFTFASFALAFGFPMVGGAKSAGKTANSNFNVTLFHLRLHFVSD